MFFPYTDENIRYTGRWGEEIDQRGVKVGCMTATTTGAYFEFAFTGRQAVLHFHVIAQSSGMPHLWVNVDGGAKIESVVMPYLRVQAATDGVHTVCVIIKSAGEELQRWYRPLTSCVALCGITADELCPLPADERKVIEFVGDSITEGILVDEPNRPEGAAAYVRLYQNDVCGTYGRLLWATALLVSQRAETAVFPKHRRPILIITTIHRFPALSRTIFSLITVQMMPIHRKKPIAKGTESCWTRSDACIRALKSLRWLFCTEYIPRLWKS